MSRELKFRAWDKEKKKYLLPEKQGFIIVPTSPSFGVTLPYHRGRNFSEDEDCFDWADADLLMGRYELEQYTGLRDKNGKEIYEGDIVKFEDCVFIIGWNDKHARFGFIPVKGCDISMTFSMKECEVIGNIHENKELLGSEE